ncbi:hypothetical protein SAMD00019534_091220 [Acytostelium subglobosum LB1]|uniref:hypothetical protein n=1 Tax=Acytostelium subglobosum LB1 TaxID=1410327 RepID=UPI000644A4DB|nr:hypothetical protein SAMD00019534_091220 [Acytostelium subglobosum LB1]GAM25947.1 hypothetical protein SAMD00019534_091220 [Acytostelium subglobosum LB1]|eukprot:XP_012750990.1 hypothetical protein SAMD00019534_091220 [Acytostelium subglobosum LB1]
MTHVHELNRLSWNSATLAHNSHKGDQAELFRNGHCTLFPEEKELLGHVSGRSLLHLQCNSGQDTLSLARLGAKVTGVDISDEAISFAQTLSANSNIPATFIRDDILHWMSEAAKRGVKFDRVFTSYGTIVWIADLKAWARGIASLLATGPDSRFVIVDFHPFALYFDQQWKPTYDYFNRDAIEESGVGDYVADSGDGLGSVHSGVVDFVNPHKSYEHFHGLGDIINALASAGLVIECVNEYPYSNGWKGFDGMVDIGGKRMVPPSNIPKIPLMYGISARHPSSSSS